MIVISFVINVKLSKRKILPFLTNFFFLKMTKKNGSSRRARESATDYWTRDEISETRFLNFLYAALPGFSRTIT